MQSFIILCRNVNPSDGFVMMLHSCVFNDLKFSFNFLCTFSNTSGSFSQTVVDEVAAEPAGASPPDAFRLVPAFDISKNGEAHTRKSQQC